jgi:hypothetical protein
MSTHENPTTPATALPSPSTLSSPKYTTEEIRQDCKLWYKIHVFIYDLRNFRSNDKSRDRLDSVVDTYYLGLPYFNATEADKILHTIGDVETGRTLKELLDDFFSQKLEKRKKSRMEETADYRVCAAHDLAPIFEKVFRVHPKDLAKNKGFIKVLNKGALGALDEGVVTLFQSSFGPS